MELLTVHPVFYKKMFAIKTLAQAYEYFILIDAEVQVVAQLDSYALCAEFFRRRIYWTSFDPDITKHQPSKISMGSMWRYNATEQAKLCSITANCSAGLWWNEIPILSSASAMRFINSRVFTSDDYGVPPYPVNFVSSAVAAAEPGGFMNGRHMSPWHEFDYIAYLYHLLLHEEFILLDVNALSAVTNQRIWGGLGHESMRLSDNVMRVIDRHWVPAQDWVRDTSRFSKFQTLMIYQTDKVTVPGAQV
jgi:hypothetical protein